MWSELLDRNLWFSQPSIILTQTDRYLGYFFAGCLILCILLKLGKRFTTHQVFAGLMDRFFYLLLTVGFSGLVWYGFRYENTPIFAARSWAGLCLAIGIVWLLFIVKYLIFNFRGEVKDYDHELIKNKYIPGKTR